MSNAALHRLPRDIIDDIMVELDLLESQLALASKDFKHKGQILNIVLYIENIRTLLIELKQVTEQEEKPSI
ncbi:MAG: hypothetical protein GSR72_07255 [Desulfurococcales archaeon]|nr:hypothetical protein [Desulfurococcales archaeon]